MGKAGHMDFSAGAFREILNSSEVRALVDAKAREIEARAKSLAPVDSGKYRDSIHIKKVQGKYREIVIIEAEDDRAAIVEAKKSPLNRALRQSRG